MAKKKQPIKVRAKEVEAALEARHGENYFFSQVKIGSAGSRIMDGYAILPTWSPITYIGYEIKVSRADFLQDDKYHEYLPFCHEFYFVAPKGVLQIEELPEGVGYMEYYPKSGTLRMKRKSARREIDGINPAIHHIFMWKLEKYKRWTKQDSFELHKTKQLSHVFGKSVSNKIAKMEEELKRYRRKADKYNELDIRVKEAFNYKIGITGLVDHAIRNKGEHSALLEDRIENLKYSLKAIQRILNQAMKEEEE